MDLFFYGSQDVPPAPSHRRDRLPRRGVAPAVCESCSAPVPPADIRDGRASEIYGLVLCETCRLKARAEERVELYFCDRCQVSVPVYRVDTGEALAGDGRILCLDCRRRPNRRLSTVVIVVLALLSLALGTWLGRDRFAAAAEDPRDLRIRELDRRLDRATGLIPALDDLEAKLDDLQGLRGDLDDCAASAKATAETLELARTTLERAREEFLRQAEIMGGDLLSLLRAADAALNDFATAER